MRLTSRERYRGTTGRIRRSLVLVLVAVVLASACTAEPKPPPSGDVPAAPKLARDAATLLLQFSVYDYALAGSLAGEKARAVPPDRYAVVARTAVRGLRTFTSSALAASANTTGPVRDRLVTLADAVNDLANDAGTYADTSDAGTFTKVVGDLTRSWQQLRELGARLPADPELERTIARGLSFTVTTKADTVFVLTAGPYSTQADAEAAAKKAGAVESVTKSPPFVVRIATYPTRAAADAATAVLVPKGLDLSTIAQEERYAFSRGPVAPDTELWREPVRIFDTWGAARRVALSPDGAWIATGSDDGTVAIFSGEGVLRALPKFQAGVSQMLFSDDGRWLEAGGATLVTLGVPSGATFGATMRFPAATGQLLFVPTARVFVAASKGATGLPAGGGGVVGGRAPDGSAIAPFPLPTPASGAAIAATEAGDLYIATAGSAGTDVEVLRMAGDRRIRGVLRLPGTARAIAVDRTGAFGAAVTDQGTFRFGPSDADPEKTIIRVADPARDIAFGADGTFYRLEQNRIIATAPGGAPRWQAVLVDGRRMVMGQRTLVLDGTDRVAVIAADGTIDDLGIGGTVQDLAVSPDGRRVAVLLESRRAVLFDLP
ncbi:MAG TPA: hypothetical protein VIN34_02180 [Candidatus Limnocylindria bacterium]